MKLRPSSQTNNCSDNRAKSAYFGIEKFTVYKDKRVSVRKYSAAIR
jgi:hypothetical protein